VRQDTTVDIRVAAKKQSQTIGQLVRVPFEGSCDNRNLSHSQP